MSTHDDQKSTDNFLETFGINKKIFDAIPQFLKSLTSVLVICGLLVFCLGVLVSIVLVVRLGIDALWASTSNFQDAAKSFLFALAAVFGAPFLVWRTWVAHLQAKAAAAQAITAQESHLTGIFTKSVELLGLVREVKTIKPDGSPVVRSLPNSESRLGALYALERLLRENYKDQQAILETLCAYIRENSPLVIPSNENDRDKISSGKEPPEATKRNDVQAAITIIGRRPTVVHSRGRKEGWRLDLRETNLVAYDFSSLNFDGSNFSGSFLNTCNFDGASLIDSKFLNTNFCEAKLNFTKFSNSSIEDCNFESAKMSNSDFSYCTIENSDLREARVDSINIKGANLEKAFDSSFLEYAVLDAKTNGANYFNATELVRTNEFFKNVQHDENTIISQAAVDTIHLMNEKT